MNVKSFLFITAFVSGFIGSAYADPAGPFGPPISETQTGPYCSTPGYKQDQYNMEWNTDFSKYHMGEDLNGVCGGDTDEGYPVLAVAGGQVIFLDNVGTVSGQGKRLYIRHSFPYAYATNDIMTLDIAMLHLQGMGPGISWSGPGTGSTVTKGQTVAYLGKTGTTSAHLHWEAQTDPTIPLGTNPYQNPLTKSHALKYRAPSLIVDDRRQYAVATEVPANGQWYQFTMQGNAPSSTMYIELNGARKSLKNAIAAGWIPSMGVLHNNNGTWYYYTDVDDNFFENGKWYAISSLVSGVRHFVPVPQNNFQGDRARLDMIHAIENDSRFAEVLTDTYEYDSIWDLNPAWEFHLMAFKLSDGRTAYVNQITYKTNRLVRNTTYYDPDLGQWTGWQWVDWNKLY